MNKLILGTAQFGFDYGINNIRGKIPKDEIFNILDRAISGGVDILDTAPAYGDCEKILGEYFKASGKRFEVISKLSVDNKEQAMRIVESSLADLNLDNIYGYLLHDFDKYYKCPEIWQALEELKAEGKISKIGFSLYYPHDLETVISRGLKIDLVQVPYSVLDQRFERYFERLRNDNVEIHVRSVFLQGLVFKRPEDLNGSFSGIKEKLFFLGGLSRKSKVSIASLCLNFVVLNRQIDKVIIGVDSLANLQEILKASKDVSIVEVIYKELASLRENNEKVLLPFNWEREKIGIEK